MLPNRTGESSRPKIRGWIPGVFLRKAHAQSGFSDSKHAAACDRTKRIYRYSLVAGVPASHYTDTIDVTPKGSGGCVAGWRVEFLANKQPDIVVRAMVSTLIKTGLGSLKRRFGLAA